MHNQLRVGFYKLRTSAVFYGIVLLFAIVGVIYGKLALIPLYGQSGGEAFLSTIGDTSFMFVLTLFVSYFVGNDFSNRSILNEVQIGHSRLSAIISRAMIVLSAAVLFHLTYVWATTLLVTVINGFGTTISIQSMAVKTVLAILQVMAIQSFPVLIMFVCKKSSLGIVMSIVFTGITCNVLRNFLGEGDLFFEVTSFYRIMMNSEMMTSNEVGLSFASAIVTLLMVFYLTYLVFRRTEIK